MSDVENVFLGVDVPLRQVADEWLGSLLELEAMPDGLDTEHEIGLRGRAVGADGWLVLLVRRNGYAEVDPGPEDVQAFDSYPIEITIRYQPKEEYEQSRQARLLFESLVAARPEAPMLLVHDLDILVGAHLPGVGTQYFTETITVDAPDQASWQPWVRRS